MKNSAFIFDLDGVIVDTATYHYLAWRRLAQELGFDFSEKENERLKGVSRMQALDILLEIGNITLSEKEKKRLADRKNQWYVEYLQQLNQESILPGSMSFLQAVRQMGIPSALGSASKNARTILDKLEITQFFDAVVDGTMTTRAKPDPEVFLIGANLLRVSPDQCIVFEDAQAGIDAALSAGMVPVGVGSSVDLKRAHLVIPSFKNMTPSDVLHQLGKPIQAPATS